MISDNNRWREITEIWRDYTIQYRFLILVVLVLAGFWLFGSNILDLTDTRLSYTTNVFTEALSIAVTVLIIEFFNRAREKRDQDDLQKRLDGQELTRLKALLGSNEAVVTKIAIAELRAEGWLYDGSLQEVNLWRSSLEGADLREACLESAKLGQVNLNGANLREAKLKGVDLRMAMLKKTSLSFADLEGARLGNANLEAAVLAETNLRNADLVGAWLLDACLIGACLIGAYLYDTNLKNVDLREAILPDGMKWSEDVDMGRFTNRRHPDYASTLEKINKIRKELGLQ